MTPSRNVLVQAGEPRGLRSARGAWQCARTDGDHALLVSFLGRPAGFPPDGPPRYVGTARDEDGALIVAVAPTPALEPLLRRGRAVGRIGVVRVPVEQWRGREIVDAATGSRRPVFDGDALLRPPGSRPPTDSNIAGRGDDRPSWQQRFAASEDHGVTLTHIVDGENAVHGVRTRMVTVRGRDGVITEERDGERLITRNLWWTERGATVHLRSAAVARPDTLEHDALGADALLAFAEALV